MMRTETSLMRCAGRCIRQAGMGCPHEWTAHETDTLHCRRSDHDVPNPNQNRKFIPRRIARGDPGRMLVLLCAEAKYASSNRFSTFNCSRTFALMV